MTDPAAITVGVGVVQTAMLAGIFHRLGGLRARVEAAERELDALRPLATGGRE